jgi:hypothetical protein
LIKRGAVLLDTQIIGLLGRSGGIEVMIHTVPRNERSFASLTRSSPSATMGDHERDANANIHLSGTGAENRATLQQ